MFLTVLEAGSLSSGTQPGQVLVRTLFVAAGGLLLIVSSHGRKGARKFSQVSFIKGTNSIHEGSLVITWSCLLIPSHGGGRFQHKIFGDMNIQSVAQGSLVHNGFVTVSGQ